MASDGKARKQDYAGGETHQIADDDEQPHRVVRVDS
jgi:hypothetical protein